MHFFLLQVMVGTLMDVMKLKVSKDQVNVCVHADRLYSIIIVILTAPVSC